jgi:hypothetical protein
VLSHLAGDVGKNVAAIGEVHAEHGAGEDGTDDPFDFYGIFLRHEGYFGPGWGDRQWDRGNKFETGRTAWTRWTAWTAARNQYFEFLISNFEFPP